MVSHDMGLHKWAVTLNINPESYITVPVSGKMARKKWRSHDNADRQFFLFNFVNLLRAQQVSPDDITYRFEDTEKGISHMHLSIKTTATIIKLCRDNFCALVAKTMPPDIKSRCVKIIKEYNTDGWIEYMRKQDTASDSLDDYDTPIKMPKRNIMIRHRVTTE